MKPGYIRKSANESRLKKYVGLTNVVGDQRQDSIRQVSDRFFLASGADSKAASADERIDSKDEHLDGNSRLNTYLKPPVGSVTPTRLKHVFFCDEGAGGFDLFSHASVSSSGSSKESVFSLTNSSERSFSSLPEHQSTSLVDLDSYSERNRLFQNYLDELYTYLRDVLNKCSFNVQFKLIRLMTSLVNELKPCQVTLDSKKGLLDICMSFEKLGYDLFGEDQFALKKSLNNLNVFLDSINSKEFLEFNYYVQQFSQYVGRLVQDGFPFEDVFFLDKFRDNLDSYCLLLQRECSTGVTFANDFSGSLSDLMHKLNDYLLKDSVKIHFDNESFSRLFSRLSSAIVEFVTVKPENNKKEISQFRNEVLCCARYCLEGQPILGGVEDIRDVYKFLFSVKQHLSSFDDQKFQHEVKKEIEQTINRANIIIKFSRDGHHYSFGSLYVKFFTHKHAPQSNLIRTFKKGYTPSSYCVYNGTKPISAVVRLEHDFDVYFEKKE